MARGIQEQVNRNRQQRGVSYYSPTRVLARPAGPANAGTAQRILQQGTQPQPEPTTTPRLRVPGVRGSLPGVELPGYEPLPVPGSAQAGGSRLRQLVGAPAAQPQAEEPGGWRGALGTVVNSWPGRAAMAALDVLDRPRRAVVSTVQEVADAINGGDAGFDDWVEQFNDPTFGFGDVVGSTGNIWADRAIGFAGDVLLDPLTYVGGSSAISGTGRSMRVGAAARAVSSGLDEDLGRRLGQFGYSSASRQERALLRDVAQDTVLDPGYYFKVPFGPRIPIPGTGRVEQGISRAFAGARYWANTTQTGGALRRIRSPEGLENAITKVVTGKGDIPFLEAAEVIRFRNAADRAGPAAVARLNELAKTMFRDNEGNDGLSRMLTRAETQGDTVINDFFEEAAKIFDEYGVKFERGPRQNYVPHIFTPEGIAWMNNRSDPVAKAFKSLFYKDRDLNEISPHLMRREIIGRDEPYDIAGKQFNIRTGTIEEINSEFARLVPEAGFKLIDDNFSTIVARYSKSLEEDIGTIAGLKSLLASKSRLVRSADDSEVTNLVADEVATKIANKALSKELKLEMRKVGNTLRNLREDVMRNVTTTRGQMAVYMRSVLDETESITAKRKAELQRLLEEDEELSRQRGIASLNGEVADAKGPSPLERELAATMDDINRRFQAVQQELLKVRARAAIELPAWEDAKRMAREQGIAAKMPPHLRNLRRWQQLYEEAAHLAMDRENIAALEARVASNRARIRLIDNRVDDQTWLYATSERLERPTQYERPGPGERRVEMNLIDDDGSVLSETRPLRMVTRDVVIAPSATTQGVRFDSQSARLRVFGGNDASPEVQALDIDIRAKIHDLYNAEVNLAEITNATRDQIANAKTAFERVRRDEVSLRNQIERMKGRRGLHNRRAELIGRHDLLTSPEGELEMMRRGYDNAQQPLKEANQRVDHHKRQLAELRQRQLDAALSDPYYLSKRAPADEGMLWPDEHAAAVGLLERAERDLDVYSRTSHGRQAARVKRELDETEYLLTGQGTPVYRRIRGAPTGPERERLAARMRELQPYTTGRFQGRNANAARAEIEQIRNRLAMVSDEAVPPIGPRIRELTTGTSTLRVVDGKVAWADKGSAEIERILGRIGGQTGPALARSRNRLAALGYVKDHFDASLRQRDELTKLLARQKELTAKRNTLRAQWADVRRRGERLTAEVARRRAPVERHDQVVRQIQNWANEADPARVEGRVRQDVQNIARAEDERLTAAFNRMLNPGSKTEWEPVPEVPPPAAQPFLYHEERILNWAYEQLQNAENGLTNTGARATIEQQRRMLDEVRDVFYPISDDARVRALDEMAEIDRLLAEVRLARMPLGFPKKGDETTGKLYDIVIARTHEAQNAPIGTDMVSRAGAAMHIAKVMDETHGQYLIERGAVFPGDIRYTRDLRKDLLKKLNAWGNNPAPNTREQIEQLTSELARWGDFMVTYKAVLDAGYEGSDQMAAFILARELLKERRVLNEQIRAMRKLVADGAERGVLKRHNDALASLRNKIDIATASIEQERRLVKAGDTAADLGLIKRETAKRSRLRARLNQLERAGPPELGAMTDDVEVLVNMLSNKDTGLIVQLSNATADYNDARHITWHAGQSRRKLEELEGSIPIIKAYVERARYTYESLRQGIARAQGDGTGLVHWQSWVVGSPVDMSVEEAKRSLQNFPAWMRPELERKIRMAEAKIERAAGWRMGAGGKPVTFKMRMPGRRAIRDEQGKVIGRTEDYIDVTLEEAEALLPDYVGHPEYQELQRKIARMARKRENEAAIRDATRVQMPTSTTGATVTPLEQATEIFHQHRNSIANFENLMRNQEIQRKVILEEAPAELASIKQVLADIENPPDPRKLQKKQNEILNRARRGNRQPTEHEAAQLEMIQARLEQIAAGPKSHDEVAEMVDQRDRLEKAISEYRALGESRDAVVSIVDNGNKLFEDLVQGRREVTYDDIELFKELLGGEGGPYAATWIQTFNEVLAGRTRLESEQLELVIREVHHYLGDNPLSERISDRLIGLAADGTLDEAGIQAARAEIQRALVAAAQSRRAEAIRDVGDMLDLIGFQFFTKTPEGNAARVFPTLSQKMSLVGYTQSKDAWDETKLRQAIMEELTRKGYDPQRGLIQRLRELEMRGQRIDTMRKALGGRVNMAHPRNPEQLHRRLHRARLQNEADALNLIAREAPDMLDEINRIRRMQATTPREIKRAREEPVTSIFHLMTPEHWERARIIANERLRSAIAAQDDEAIEEAQGVLDALRMLQVGGPEDERARGLWDRIAERIDDDNPQWIAEDADAFTVLYNRPEIEEAFVSRSGMLQQDLADAVNDGNEDAVREITQLIQAHELGPPVTIMEATPDPVAQVAPRLSTPGHALGDRVVLPVEAKHMAPTVEPVGGYVDGAGNQLPPPVRPIPTFTDGRRSIFAVPAPKGRGWTIKMMELSSSTRRRKVVHLQGHNYSTAEEASEAIANLQPGEIWVVGDAPPAPRVAEEIAPEEAIDAEPPGAIEEMELPPGEEVVEPIPDAYAEERRSLQAQLDQTNAEATTTRRQIEELESSKPTTTPGSSDPLGELDMMAADVASGDRPQPPEGFYSRADENRTRARMLELQMKGANRSPEESQRMQELSEQFVLMSQARWEAEPVEQLERADRLLDQIVERLEGGADEATGTVDDAAHATLLQKLRDQEAQALDLQRRIDEMPQPDVGGQTDVVAPSSVTEPQAQMAAEGVAPVHAAPDEVPPQVSDVGLNDMNLTTEQLIEEHQMVVREFTNLSARYGGMKNAPPEIQTQLGELAARAKQLARLQDTKANPLLRGTPDWERYRMLTQSAPLSVAADWRNLLRNGSPSSSVNRALVSLDPSLEHMVGGAESRFMTTLTQMSGGRGTLSGRMFAGGLGPREAGIERRLDPMRNLQQRLRTARAEAVEQSQADLAEIGDLSERVAANEARITAEREAIRLAQTSGVDISDIEARRADVAEGYHQQQRQLRHQQVNMNLERWQAETAYTAKLKEIDMQLGDVRERVGYARKDMAQRAEEKRILDNAIKGSTKSKDIHQLIDDLGQVNEWRREELVVTGLMRPEDLEAIETVEDLLDAATRAQIELDKVELNSETISRRLDDIAKDPTGYNPVMKRIIVDGWKPVAARLLHGDDRVIAAQSLSNALENVVAATLRPEPWKLVDKYTAFFKTYATARPGFHVRNALSAIFMNLVDGVRIGELASAPGTWRAFTRDPIRFWENAGNQVLNQNTKATMRDALNIVFGSGAGGQFEEFGVGLSSGISSKMFQRLMNNRYTRWNRRVGAAVEGTQRLAMAVDGLRKGMSVDAVLDRVTKFHFNYNQVSTFDRSAKRLIPFWTFMSRNLPLQLEQMWLRPRTYLQYQSFVRNFAEEADPLTPEYWLMQGAFTMDPEAAQKDSPWYLAPDLPHLRIAEDISALTSGDLGKAFLSGVNPAFLSPAEAFGFGRKAYTGAPIEGYEEAVGPMKALLPLLSLLGATETGASGQTVVDSRYAHVARSTLPPLELLERFISESGVRAGRQDETFYRQMLGLPVYQLTPELRSSTARTNYWNRRDQRSTQADLARL